MFISSISTKNLERTLVIILALLMLFGALFSAYADEDEEPYDTTETTDTATTDSDEDEKAPESYEEGDVRLSMPEKIWKGNEFEVTLSLSLPASHAINGSINYDSGFLTLVEYRTALPEWTLLVEETEEGLDFICIDVSLAYPAEGITDVLVVKFRLNDTADKDSITLDIPDISITDGNSDIKLEGGVFTKEISPPLERTASLKTLFVRGIKGGETEDHALTPEFDPTVTEYEVYVDHDKYSDLEIIYTCDDFSHAEINKIFTGELLTSCEITVISDDGAEGRKYILLFKEPVTNLPSGDSGIKEITLSDGILSHTFSPSVYEYTVYVTSEIKEVKITATPNSFAASVEELTLNLKSTEKQVLVCRAEDGSTTEYYFTVKVISERAYAELSGEKYSDSISLGAVLVIVSAVALTGILIGFVIALAVRSGKKKSKTDNAENNITIPTLAQSEEKNGDSKE